MKLILNPRRERGKMLIKTFSGKRNCGRGKCDFIKIIPKAPRKGRRGKRAQRQIDGLLHELGV